MNTVGVFAGRGDVILGMSFALAFGVIAGWWFRGKRDQFVAWWERKFPKQV